jgi:flavin-dependent dehydrogenase
MADVIVVGAGPAGSATALLLARAGHHVLMLERQHHPRAKACGDCLSAGATPLLARLGVLSRVLAARPAQLTGWRIITPRGESVSAAFAESAPGALLAATALALPRARLDAALAEEASGAGAELRTGVRVSDLLRDAGGRVVGVRGEREGAGPFTLRAPLVVGADGLRSIVARRLGLVRRPPRVRKLSLTAHVAVAGVGEMGEMHLGEGACVGVAPVERGAEPLCNLTLVVDAARSARHVAAGAERFFWRTLERFPRLRGRLPPSPALPLLASGPFDWEMRTVTAPGAALVGDAAGYFDPMTGQGIFQALASAELLADAADALLRAPGGAHEPLLHYERRRARLLGGARRVQRLLEFITARPLLAELALRALAHRPSATRQLIAVTGDLLPARSLLAPRTALALLLGTDKLEAQP